MLFLLSFYNVFFFYSSIENHLDKRPVHAHGLSTSNNNKSHNNKQINKILKKHNILTL